VFIIKCYQPVLAAAMRQRYLTLALFLGSAIIVISLVISGQLRFVFFPRIQSEVASASLEMPPGTAFEITDKYIELMTHSAQRLQEKYVDPVSGESVITHILSTTGQAGSGGSGQAHIGRVMFEIVPPEERTLEVTSSQLVEEWRRSIGDIPGAQELNFRAEFGRGGDPLDIQFTGSDFSILQALVDDSKTRLQQYPGIFDISDSFTDGKEEIQLAIKPQAELLGLSLTDLARQVRQAFFGFEVQRIQRGRDDVRVMVRYPLAERRSLENLEAMKIRTPAGVEVPFSEVAAATSGHGFSSIRRIDRNRTINVTADVNKESADIEAIKTDLTEFLDNLLARYPGVHYSLEGEAREQRESFRSLTWGLAFVLFAIYALLAIPFKSYSQPLMVMCVIPFGIVGAILGHLVMDMTLSIMSMMGMLALSGVVVNDSLVLVDYINRRRREGIALTEAVRTAGVARFRAVLLTSLTTFAGLMPLIFEKSTQAQFLIPMAVSLGFGILFATFITLLLIPINYLILEDFFSLFRKRDVVLGQQ
jgi:multidrug efflux pump subunit AcrB